MSDTPKPPNPRLRPQVGDPSAGPLRGPLGPIPRRAHPGSRRPVPALGWITIAGYTGLGVGCVLAAAATFLLIAGPVDFVRDRVIEQVKARTGRDLVIAGPASLSFFPRLGASLSHVSLSAPAEMGGPPTLTAQTLDVELPFSALLSRKVIVHRVRLDGASIDLRVDANGRRSWEYAAAAEGSVRYAQLPGRIGDTQTDATDAGSTKRSAKISARLDQLAPLTVTIANSTIRYSDARSGATHQIEGLAADLALADGNTVVAKGSAAWKGERVVFDVRLAQLQAALRGEHGQLSLSVAGKPLEGTYQGTVGLAGEPEFDGTLKLRAASAEATPWLARLRRPSAEAEPLTLTSRVVAANRRIELADLSATLGDGSLSGSLSVETGGVRPRVRGQLQLSELDLGRLLIRPAQSEGAVGDPIGDILRKGDAPEKATRVQGFTKRSGGKGWSDDILDITPLTVADADLELSVERVLYKEVVTGRTRVVVALKDKVARLTLEDMPLYEGRGRGVLTLDGTGPILSTSVKLDLDRVAMLPLLENALDFSWLDGRGRVGVAVSGQGMSERQIIETLRGKVDILAVNGVIAGIDLPKALNGLAQARLPSLELNPREKTPFTELGASFVITDGVAQNQDLRLVSSALHVSGSGSANLGQRQIDYTVRPKIVAAAGSDSSGINLSGLEVPVHITGAWDKPSFTPDLKSVLGSEQAGEVINRIGKNLKSQEVQDAVRGLLGGGGDGQKVKPRDLLDKLLKKD